MNDDDYAEKCEKYWQAFLAARKDATDFDALSAEGKETFRYGFGAAIQLLMAVDRLRNQEAVQG